MNLCETPEGFPTIASGFVPAPVELAYLPCNRRAEGTVHDW